jgi:hypothetical protein
MKRRIRLIIIGAVLGLAPFLIFIGSTSLTVENGVVTSYFYFNLAAIIGGIFALGMGIALARRDAETGAWPPRWVIPVCAALILLGAFQIVRGSGLLPGITGCTTESGTGGVCTATTLTPGG